MDSLAKVMFKQKKKPHQTHKHQTPAEVPCSIEGKNMEAENVQEKKSFSFRCIVLNHQNMAERKAEASNCTEGKLKHRGSVMKGECKP